MKANLTLPPLHCVERGNRDETFVVLADEVEQSRQKTQQIAERLAAIKAAQNQQP